MRRTTQLLSVLVAAAFALTAAASMAFADPMPAVNTTFDPPIADVEPEPEPDPGPDTEPDPWPEPDPAPDPEPEPDA